MEDLNILANSFYEQETFAGIGYTANYPDTAPVSVNRLLSKNELLSGLARLDKGLGVHPYSLISGVYFFNREITSDYNGDVTEVDFNYSYQPEVRELGMRDAYAIPIETYQELDMNKVKVQFQEQLEHEQPTKKKCKFLKKGKCPKKCLKKGCKLSIHQIPQDKNIDN